MRNSSGSWMPKLSSTGSTFTNAEAMSPGVIPVMSMRIRSASAITAR